MPTVLARLYDAVCALIDYRQVDRDILTFLKEFNALSNKVLLVIPRTTDPVKCEEQQELLIIVCFLRGLLPKFEPARTRVLNQVPTPTLEEVGATMIRYEAYLDGSASVSTQEPNGESFSHGGRKSKAACSRCHRHGHTRDTCGVLSGRPSRC